MDQKRIAGGRTHVIVETRVIICAIGRQSEKQRSAVIIRERSKGKRLETKRKA